MQLPARKGVPLPHVHYPDVFCFFSPHENMLSLFIALLPAVNPGHAFRVDPGHAFRVDPGHARNITVYHVNEHKYGAIPLNMNTADVIGDLFFDLLEIFIAPLACANQTGPPKPGPNPCANPEAVGADLMVNKLTLEIDERYSGYAACNVAIRASRTHIAAFAT